MKKGTLEDKVSLKLQTLFISVPIHINLELDILCGTCLSIKDCF